MYSELFVSTVLYICIHVCIYALRFTYCLFGNIFVYVVCTHVSDRPENMALTK